MTKKDSRPARMRAHAQVQRERWAQELTAPDRELLAMRDSGLTLRQIAVRMGISWNAVRLRILAAQRREALRQDIN